MKLSDIKNLKNYKYDYSINSRELFNFKKSENLMIINLQNNAILNFEKFLLFNPCYMKLVYIAECYLCLSILCYLGYASRDDEREVWHLKEMCELEFIKEIEKYEEDNLL